MRIVLADDHVILLDAIKRVLEPEFKVVGTFCDGQSMLNSLLELDPDIVVLDIGMPMMNGLTAATKVKKILPGARIVFLTMDQDQDTAAEAFKLGASGYIIKTSAASELVQALRVVSWGGYFTSPALTKDMVGSHVRSFRNKKPAYQITPRQREVLQLISEGFSMNEIADHLGITARTVAFHKYTMMQELMISSTAELISFGIKNAIIKS